MLSRRFEETCLVLALAVALGGAMLSAPAEAREDVAKEIFEIFDSIHQGIEPRVLPTQPHSTTTLGLLYTERDYQPAWSGYDQIQELLKALADSELDGLTPDDYHYSVLKSLESEYFASRNDAEKARLHAAFDVLLSDGILLYALHLQEGKVDPAQVEPTWNFSRRELEPEQIAMQMGAAIEQGTVLEKLDEFRPELRFYQLMRDELARYRELDARYATLNLPEDQVLKPGMRHPNVAILREQLKRLGYEVAATDAELFGEPLENAVRRFQKRHSIDADGVVGRDSFRELNVPYAERIDQIRLNLDRVRWVQDDATTSRLVIVNIPGFELYFMKDTQLAWQTDVMVGTIRTQTPIFREDMHYLEFNPTWTVPRSIIGRSLYAKFAADPSYITEHNYSLYNSDGVAVDPQSIDWTSTSRNRFPYRVVQQPGPGNALGQVKFMFPNQYAIYLHDTPAKALFSRTARAFSAGCVRVYDPFHFAELLLEDESGWSREKIDAVVDGGKRTVVRFQEPVDIMLMYWTTSPDPDSGIQFHPDVYNRDPKSLALLNEEPSWFAQ